MKTLSYILALQFVLLIAAPASANGLLAAESSVSASNDIDSQDLTTEKKKDKDIISIKAPFFINLGIDIAFVLLIIGAIYYPNYRRLDTIFTFIVFNVVIFLLTFVLNKVKISMGAAFGLFAVFSMLRYRTAGIGMKDMTYLFVFIAIGLISGIQLEPYELAIIGGLIFVVTLLLDSKMILKREENQCLQFERIELIKPQHHDELMQELRTRTGLNIHRFSIGKLDYLKDSALIEVYYYK